MTPPAGALSGFPWPRLPAADHPPRWEPDGFHFATGGPAQRVLTYAQATSHWSEELTAVHEAEAGEGTHPIDRASRALALRTIARHVPPAGGIILDVGCSSGFFLRDLRARFPGLPAIGADYLAGPLHRLAPRLPGVPLLQFDLRSCPLPDGQLAAVVCLNVLEHIDDDRQALREIHRLLRPGGVAHIEVPAGPGCYDIYDEFLLHHRRYSMAELSRKAAEARFEPVSRTHLGALVYPGFYAVKWRQRRLLPLPAEHKAALVRKMMRATGHSRLIDLALRLELALGRVLRFPFGIRCVAVLRKPTGTP